MYVPKPGNKLAPVLLPPTQELQQCIWHLAYSPHYLGVLFWPKTYFNFKARQGLFSVSVKFKCCDVNIYFMNGGNRFLVSEQQHVKTFLFNHDNPTHVLMKKYEFISMEADKKDRRKVIITRYTSNLFILFSTW